MIAHRELSNNIRFGKHRIALSDRDRAVSAIDTLLTPIVRMIAFYCPPTGDFYVAFAYFYDCSDDEIKVL